MRSFRRFTSGESQAAAARFPDFLLAMASPLKKSLRAAERKRADVARARRRWIREQGFLEPAHLVFIDETAVTTNMLRLNGWNPRGERLVSDADGTLGDGDVYRWPASNRRRGSDADQRSHEWRGFPGLHRAMFGPNAQAQGHCGGRQRPLPQGCRCGRGDPGCWCKPPLLASVFSGPSPYRVAVPPSEDML